MTEFARLVRQEDDIWLEQGEDELEKALQVSMGAIVGKVMLTWLEMVLFSEEPDPHYLVERKFIAGRQLKYISGYAEGPRNWLFSTVPFRRIVESAASCFNWGNAMPLERTR